MVEGVEPVEQARLIAANQLGTPYTPAWAVKVIREVATACLFGLHGAEVCSIINAATTLTIKQAIALGQNRHPDASLANSRAWHVWIEQTDHGPRVNLDNECSEMNSSSGVVSGSPLGTGLQVLHDELWKRAGSVSGLAAFESSDDETWLAEPWSDALSALLDTALACGAPQLVGPDDRPILLAAWNKLILEGQ